MQANVVANLPGKQGMLVRGIVAHDENGRSIVDLAHRCGSLGLATQGGSESREVRSAMVINVVRLENDASKFREQIILFVGGSRRADHPDGLPAILVSDFGKAAANQGEGFFPRGGC